MAARVLSPHHPTAVLARGLAAVLVGSPCGATRAGNRRAGGKEKREEGFVRVAA